MNAKNFFEYIDNPSLLYQISYQELKSLVLQYPFSQNLRYLLLQKSKMENHKDFQRNLEMAATYSPDRTYLFNLLKEMESKIEEAESYSIAEEVLELKDLGKLESEIDLIEVEEKQTEELSQFAFQPEEPKESIPAPQNDYTELNEDDGEDFLEDLLAETIPLANSASDDPYITDLETLTHTIDEIAPPIEGDIAPEDEEIPSEPTTSIEGVIEVLKVNNIIDDTLIDNLASFSEVIEGLNFDPSKEEDVITSTEQTKEHPLEIANQEVLSDEWNAEETAPEPKTTFNSWLQQLNAPIPEKRLDELMEISKKAKERRKELQKKAKKLSSLPKKAKKPQSNKKKATQLAKESIQEDDEIATKTLAMILESQGHIKKALDMYQRLSLQNPEKSSSFAAKIEELKSLL